jgi:nitrite reductase (NADH) small subunit
VSEWQVVAKVGDLKPGDVIGVEVRGIPMVLGLDGDRYFAMQRQCVHRGGDLADGIVARGHVVCANHGWRFSTATGRHDQASDVCLVVYAVRVSGEQIEIDPVPRTLRGPDGC